jgi:hypothetical protein
LPITTLPPTKNICKDFKGRQIEEIANLECNLIEFSFVWTRNERPSIELKINRIIVKVKVAGYSGRIQDWLGSDVSDAFGGEIRVEWFMPIETDFIFGFVRSPISDTTWSCWVRMTTSETLPYLHQP